MCSSFESRFAGAQAAAAAAEEEAALAAEEAALAREEALLAAHEAALAAAEAERRAAEAAMKRACLNHRPSALSQPSSTRPSSPPVFAGGQSTCHCRASPGSSPVLARRSPRPPHAFYDMAGLGCTASTRDEGSSPGRLQPHGQNGQQQRQHGQQPQQRPPQQQQQVDKESSRWHQALAKLSLLPHGGLESVPLFSPPRKQRVSSEVISDSPEPEPDARSAGGGRRAQAPLEQSPPRELAVSRAALRSASRMIATQLVADAAAKAASEAQWDAGSMSKKRSQTATSHATGIFAPVCPRAHLLLLLVLRRRCCGGRLLLRHALLIAAVCAAAGTLLQHFHMRVHLLHDLAGFILPAGSRILPAHAQGVGGSKFGSSPNSVAE